VSVRHCAFGAAPAGRQGDSGGNANARNLQALRVGDGAARSVRCRQKDPAGHGMTVVSEGQRVWRQGGARHAAHGGCSHLLPLDAQGAVSGAWRINADEELGTDCEVPAGPRESVRVPTSRCCRDAPCCDQENHGLCDGLSTACGTCATCHCVPARLRNSQAAHRFPTSPAGLTASWSNEICPPGGRSSRWQFLCASGYFDGPLSDPCRRDVPTVGTAGSAPPRAGRGLIARPGRPNCRFWGLSKANEGSERASMRDRLTCAGTPRVARRTGADTGRGR
jgi:hypothetical protein